MAKEYEFIPGVKVTDADDYSANSLKRLDTSKYKQLDRSLNGSTFPTQAFLDKLSKHYPFNGSVCKSWIDSESKEIIYIKMVNSDNTDFVRISFAEAAKNMGWKSFKLSEDEQTVILVK